MAEHGTAPPRITLDTADGPQDTIVEGPGWRQITPARGDRYYERSGLDVTFISVTALLAKAWPGDFSGPTQHWTVADALTPEYARLLVNDRDAAKEWLLAARDRHLDAAAARGSAVHRAAEAISLGRMVDHADLERHEALEYLAGVRAFFDDFRPLVVAAEVVCFDEEHGAAGTCDLLARDADGAVYVIDYKTRTRNHDRRTKEAAQLGAYAGAINGWTGYYLDDAGRQRNIEVDRCAVVTFAPDGSYAIHEVSLDDATDAWTTANRMLRYVPVGNVYARAIRGTLDAQADIADRVGALVDGSPDKMRLAKLWTANGLPRVADITLEHWATADALLASVEPFPEAPAPTESYATPVDCGAMADRVALLPRDLRDGLAGLPVLTAPTLTDADLEEWDRHVGMAEAAAAHRVEQAHLLLSELAVA